MGDFLIVSLAEELQAYEDLAQEYQVGFEINDFYDPLVFEDKKRREDIIQKYQKAGIPAGSTMHGAFYDVSVFSYDPQIREISKLRMRQSMEIAQELSVKGVVFHTNWNPMLSNIVYDDQVVDGTCTFVRELLEAYPEIQIYMENMFDDTPELLAGLAEELKGYKNFGVCFDYAHAHVFGNPDEIGLWVQTLAPYVKHLHINDNDFGQDLHLSVGDGKIDWKMFKNYYENYFPEATVLIEVNGMEKIRKSLDFLESL